VEEGGKFFVELFGYKVELSEEKQAALKAEGFTGTKEVTVGVRPVHIALAEEGVDATVEVCEMMGSECHLHATVEGKNIIVVVQTTDIDVNKFMKAADEAIPVKITFPNDLIHVFDKETGKNMF
jgi:multiple sugar transport system ATP-binding protein